MYPERQPGEKRWGDNVHLLFQSPELPRGKVSPVEWKDSGADLETLLRAVTRTVC